jgi:hypothetical protein
VCGAVVDSGSAGEVYRALPSVHDAVPAKSVKVTVPVGLLPPVTVALSWIAVPRGPPAEASVVIAGVALLTDTGSEPQTLLTVWFAWSPL